MSQIEGMLTGYFMTRSCRCAVWFEMSLISSWSLNKFINQKMIQWDGKQYNLQFHVRDRVAFSFNQRILINQYSTMKHQTKKSEQAEEQRDCSGDIEGGVEEAIQSEPDQQLKEGIDENQAQLDREEYQQKQSNRGVCYLSRIPPYMKPNYIRRLLQGYLVERIYLLPESEWTRKNRIKKGGNKKICFREGWVEFGDKRMAKMAALTLNGQKMVTKKGNFYSEDLWNLKYLAKFKWHHLTERLAHEERLKKERLKVQLEMQRKVDEYYSENMAKSRHINAIVEKKIKKGKQIREGPHQRDFRQVGMAPDIKDQ